MLRVYSNDKKTRMKINKISEQEYCLQKYLGKVKHLRKAQHKMGTLAILYFMLGCRVERTQMCGFCQAVTTL